MLISEQKYANKNRLYYRGLADNDKSSKFYKETYLTTRLIYALAYSFGLKGVVEVYRLKDTANIFNMRFKTDEGNLRKFCQEHKMSKYLKHFETLKNNDWLRVLGEDRQKLINAIKSMGYDGYFNSEIDESRYEELKNSSFCNFSALQVKSPSVAIFNLDKSCEMVAVYNSKEDFEKSSEIKEIKQQQKDHIIRSAAYFAGKTEEEIFYLLRRRIITLTDEEIRNDIKKLKKQKIIKKQKEKEEKYLDNIRKRISGRSKGLFC